MPRIVEFKLKGYRAISEPITLGNLGTYVALYGDNAVGKSSVLQAVALLGQLCATHPAELLGTGRPWPFDAFIERFGQDAWMFNSQSSDVVELAATMDTGLQVAFTLTYNNLPLIEVACTRAVVGGIDLAVELASARRAALDAQVKSREAGLWDQAQSVLEMDASARLLSTAYERLFQALAPFRVAVGSSPVLPVPDPIRVALFGAMTSTDAALRSKVRSVMRRFGMLFPALGQGEIDVLGNPPGHEKDLAWVTADSTVDLDHLGGGVQSVIATLASLLLGRAPVACLDEPEAFVGARALDGLAAIFRGAASEGICEQVWIATHAVTLVGAQDAIVVLERAEGGVVIARQGPAVELSGRFAEPAPAILGDHLGRLGQDGSVRLPQPVIERAGLRPGDFVYFADDEQGIRILNGKQLDAASPEPDEP